MEGKDKGKKEEAKATNGFKTRVKKPAQPDTVRRQPMKATLPIGGPGKISRPTATMATGTTSKTAARGNRTPTAKMPACKVSTPVDNKSSDFPFNCDTSCISHKVGSFDESRIVAPIKKLVQDSAGKRDTSKSLSGSSKDNEEVTDLMMEQTYSRYVQSLALRHLAKKAKERVEREADQQLYAAWLLLEETKTNLEKKRDELEGWRRAVQLQDHVRSGSQAFNTAHGALDRVEKKLECLSEGLYNAQHHLIVEGVALQTGGDKRAGEAVLGEMLGLLDSLLKDSQVCWPDADLVENRAELADTLRLIVSKLRALNEVNKSNMFLVRGLENLAVQESSYKICDEKLKKSS